ncbi:MAG: S-methyl-5-thioribose-1-phosphate isomerase [Alphaproteobacteria bacterium]
MKTGTYADNLPKTIEWKDGHLLLLDQTRLPNETLIEEQKTAEQVYDSIKQLKVRGAPAIGVAGAYGLIVGLRPFIQEPLSTFQEKIQSIAAYLDSSRPTAVNLNWALERLKSKAVTKQPSSSKELWDILEKEAIAIHNEDKQLSMGIAENGLPLIKPDMGIITHCNAGSLATSILGTATAPMYLAKEKGIHFRVYSDETRPLLQGARLTSWELHKAGIDVTLICDNMAASMMKEGLIDIAIVGTDRVAANGDVANKIGTFGLAIMAKYFNIPFYVAVPSSTIDLNTKTGDDIPIEERDGEEVRYFGERRTALQEVKVRNPAFDVTPHDLVSGFITEKAIITGSFEKEFKKLLF